MRKRLLALKMLPVSIRREIPNISSWKWEELDALNIMIDRTDIQDLLQNFRCSIGELRSAISTQITCSLWASGTDEVQHCATYMLAGKALMPQYIKGATDLLSSFIPFAEGEEREEDVDDLKKAITFLERFKD
jgi:predicted anti-sigma-YlaC factor YlaD